MSENQVVFFMWNTSKQSLIDKHNFYLTQVRIRLLSQFDDIEAESKQAAEDWLSKNSRSFDPDRHDVGSYYEASFDACLEHYQLLTDMRDQTRLSVVAGMFHEWEKQLRDWMSKEVRKFYSSETAAGEVWVAKFDGIIELLEVYGWPVRSKQYFKQLDACHCLVNVYKHGGGKSFGKLKEKYPCYLVNPFATIDSSLFDSSSLDHTYVQASDVQLKDFSDAIIEFWQDVPERLYSRDDMDVPNWFGKAVKKDQDARTADRSAPKP